MIKTLSAADQDDLDQKADAFVSIGSSTGMELGGLQGIGEAAKGLMGQSSRGALAISTAVAAPAVLWDYGKSAITGQQTNEAGDWVFKNITEPFGKDVVDYWRPDPNAMSEAARIASMGFDMIGAIPQFYTGAGRVPTLAIAGNTTAPLMDAVDQGVSREGLYKIGAVNLVTNGVAVALPPAWGRTLGTRAATGAGANAAAGMIQDGATASVLSAEGNPNAELYDWANLENRLFEAGIGAIFGAKVHMDAKAGARNLPSKEQQAAIYTEISQDHLTNQTLPGLPISSDGFKQHNNAMDAAIQAVLRGEQADVAATIDLNSFLVRPELRPAAYSPASTTGKTAGNYGAGFLMDPTVYGNFDSYRVALESSGRATAKSKDSTATGLHQFVDDTWLSLVQKYKPAWAKGMGRQQILDVRNDPDISADMVRLLDQENLTMLANAGLPVNFHTMYAMHHFGPRGKRFAAADGDVLMDQILTPDQLAANKYLKGKTKDQAIAIWDKRAKEAGAPVETLLVDAPKPADKAAAADPVLAQQDPAAADGPRAFMPDMPSLYFDVTNDTPMMRVDDLVPTKENRDPSGALARMREASSGGKRRKPIDVLLNIDGTAHVVDGNGTLAAAKGLRFKELPVNIVGLQSIEDQLQRFPALNDGARAEMAGLYRKAESVHPEFKKSLNTMAAAVGGRAIVPSLKSVRRAADKVAFAYNNDATRLKDLVRGSIEIERIDSADAVVEAIRAQFGEPLKLKNTLDPNVDAPLPNQYRDINAVVMMNGVPVEIQINVPEMIAAKKKAHTFYEQAQVIERRLVEENREPTPEERARLAELDQLQAEIYAPAWEAAKRRLNSSSEMNVASSRNIEPMMRLPSGQVRQSYSDSVASAPLSSTPNMVPGGNLSGIAIGATSTEILTQKGFSVVGDMATVTTERGLDVPVRYVLVDMAELVTSHTDALTVNPAYPAELQPRDRSRAASEQQIARIANNVKPELLAESPKAADGAPIIGQDKVVESGNARTIALRRAYEAGKADQYRRFLKANAERYGLDPAAVDAMQQPVLARVTLAEYDRAEFARQANESTVATMSATEQAMADAARMPDLGALVPNDDGTINMRASADFVRQFIEGVGPNERAAMSTADGSMSQQGQARIRNAVFAKAYGDSDLVAMMAEATDANVKNVLSGMLRAAPAIAKLRELIAEGHRYGPDFAPDLVAAARKFSQLRSDGFTVEQFEAQGDMFGESGLSPKARELLRTIGENARAPRRMAEFLQQYVDATHALGDPMQAALFGDAGANADDVIRVANERTRAANQAPDQPNLIAENVAEGYDLFGAPIPDRITKQARKLTKTVPTYKGQPDLFTLPEGYKDGEVQKQTPDGWRQDAEPATLERAFGALESLVRRHSGSVLHQRLADGFLKGKANLLIGQKVQTPEDLAVLVEQYRNPHFETLRYVFAAEDGTILGETAISQRLPSASVVFPHTIDGNNRQATADWLRAQADAFGAKQFWLSHNHPSGMPMPSQADYVVSKRIMEDGESVGLTYKGHVVTNHKTFHVINPDNSNYAGRMDGADTPDPLRQGSEQKPTVFDYRGVADFAKRFADTVGDDDAVVIAVTSRSEANAIISIPASSLTPEAMLRIPALLRRSGAIQLFLAGKGGVEAFFNRNRRNPLPFTDVLIMAPSGQMLSMRQNVPGDFGATVKTTVEANDLAIVRENGPDYNKPKPEVPEYVMAPEEPTPEQMLVIPKAEAEQMVRTREQQQAEYEKQLALRQKALSAVAEWNLQRAIAAYPAPPMVALDRILARSGKVEGNVLSVESQAKAVRADAFRQLVDTLQATAPKFFGLMENMDGVRALVMELHGQDSGNPDAARGAAAFRKVTDQLRERFNRGGGNVGKLEDWGMPHHHSQYLVAKDGLDKWMAKTKPLLNRERYDMTDAEFNALLARAWETIATNGVNKQTPGQFRGAGKVANRGSDARQLHFRDGDAYLQYQQMYGESSPYETITGHINSVAHDIALIEVFGPNPDQMFAKLKDTAYQQTVMQDPANLDKHDKQAAWLDTLFREVAGKGKPIANRNLARAFDEWRSLMVASKLGSATITALTDHGTMHTAATAAGLPQMQLLANELAAFNPANTEERARINRMGLGLATLIGEVNRFGNDVVASGIFNRLGSAVLRVSGLQASTDARRRAYGVTMMDAIGALTNKHESLADLDPMDNRVLLSKGVTETDFAIWKLAEKDALGSNHTLLHPDAIYAIPDSALRPMADRLFMDADLDALRQQAVTKLLGVVLEEVDMGVIEPGARERALMHGDRVRGTWKGEIMATVMLFKSFPVAMITKHWQRAASMPTAMQKGQYAALLLASTTALGMMALQVANLLQGKDPADMTDGKNWIKAILKGGGLSLFGDFAFNDTTQFGRSFLAAAAGPGASTVEEVASLTLGNMHQAARGEKTHIGAEMVKFAKGNTPFANLWYTRAATDHLIIHELQEMASPGYLRKMEKRARKEYGETYFWKPGQPAPARAPDFDKAVGE